MWTSALWLRSAFAAFVLMAMAGATRTGTGHRRGEPRSPHLRPVRGAGPPRPFRFDQKLLICNAYPSKGLMTVKKNAREALVDEKHGIPFRECRYVPSRVQQADTLHVHLENLDVHGSFEVGALPNSDAVLLLVLDKNVESSLVNFQSFAFPAQNGKDAQLAVIDAFIGNSSTPRLKMEDHITSKEAQTISKRVEQLSFSRVYAIEPGSYDASILDHTGDAVADNSVEQSSRRYLDLSGNQNYVVLRTGGDSPDFPPGLVVFPDAAMRSAARPNAAVAGSLITLILCVLAATASSLA